jgi:hypothetical protein
MIKFPKRITAGDSLKLSIDPQYLGGVMYSAIDYTLKIILRGIGGSVDIEATQSSNQWIAVMTPLQSQVLQAGVVKWVAIASKGTTERVTVGNGTVLIEVDLTGATNYDARTIAQKALAAAENALATFASSGGKVKKYVIANRQMEFETSAEIMVAINYWKIKVANEQGKNRDLLVRFSNGV